MSDYKPGDLVNITIKGARVHFHNPDICELTVGSDADANSDLTTFDLGCEQVTVERIAPAEWPPQQGDLWRDSHGSLWFALGRRVLMVPGDPVGDLGGYEPDKVLAKVGPLTLVRREGASS